MSFSSKLKKWRVILRRNYSPTSACIVVCLKVLCHKPLSGSDISLIFICALGILNKTDYCYYCYVL